MGRCITSTSEECPEGLYTWGPSTRKPGDPSITLQLWSLDGKVARVGESLGPRKVAVEVDSLAKFSLGGKEGP